MNYFPAFIYTPGWRKKDTTGHSGPSLQQTITTRQPRLTNVHIPEIFVFPSVRPDHILQCGNKLIKRKQGVNAILCLSVYNLIRFSTEVSDSRYIDRFYNIRWHRVKIMDRLFPVSGYCSGENHHIITSISVTINFCYNKSLANMAENVWVGLCHRVHKNSFDLLFVCTLNTRYILSIYLRRCISQGDIYFMYDILKIN